MSYLYEENLIKLLPEKFHNIQRLIEYIASCGEVLDDQVLLIENLKQLTNVDEVPIEFIQFLGDLILYSTYGKNDLTEQEKRRQVKQAVEWYKIKGLYESFKVLFYSLGINAEIRDLWTGDYITFVTDSSGISDASDGFLQMDSGLFFDTDLILTQLYKSPHFNLEVDFNQDKGGYLFTRKEDDLLRDRIDVIRPAHTVPNYAHKLNVIADETKNPFTQTNNVSAVITNNWVDTIKLLDTNLLFDEGNVLDFTVDDVFNDIVKFSIGDGNRIRNGFFELWSSGDTSTPDDWTLNGTGVSIRKDAVNKSIGRFSSAFTLLDDFSNVYLYQDYSNYDDLVGETIVVQFRTKTLIDNQIRIVLDDGVDTTTSTYNTGSGDWEVLSVAHTLNGGAAQLRVRIEINASGTANLDQVRLFQNSISPVPPTKFWSVLDNSVLTATIDSKSSFSDRLEFRCVIPIGITYEALSEVALLDNSLTMFAAGVFPDSYKASDSQLEIIFPIYKTPLI